MNLFVFVAVSTLVYAQNFIGPPIVRPAQPPVVYGLPYRLIDQPLTPYVRCAYFDKEGYMVAQSPPPNAKQFMKVLNCGLPGVCDSTPANSSLEFGQNQCVGGNQPFRFNMGDLTKQKSNNNSSMMDPQMLNALGQMGRGGRSPTNANNSYSGGSNSGGSTGGSEGGSGGGGNTGPDSLCQAKDGESEQTKIRPELKGKSWCRIIQDTILETERSEGCNPSTTDYANMLAKDPPIKEMEESFCPGWNTIKGNADKRAIFLMNFIAAIVTQESSWNPKTVGDTANGPEKASKGLLQLTASSDYSKGCGCNNLRSEADTFDAEKNLRCGTHMILKYMAEDRTVGRGVGGKKHNPDPVRGIAKSFGPFRTGRPERDIIMKKTRAYCEKTLGAGAAAPAAGAHDAEATP